MSWSVLILYLYFCLFWFRWRNVFFDSMHFVIKAQTNTSSRTLSMIKFKISNIFSVNTFNLKDHFHFTKITLYAIPIFAFHVLFMFVPKLVFILTSSRITFPGTDLSSVVAIAWVIWLMMSAVIPILH